MTPFCSLTCPLTLWFQTDGASTNGDSEALISDTESVGDSAMEDKINGAAAKKAEETKTEESYSDEELEKAEAFKTKGNDFFKSTYLEISLV